MPVSCTQILPAGCLRALLYVEPRLQCLPPLLPSPRSVVRSTCAYRPPLIDAIVSLFKHEQLPLGDYYF